MKARDMQTIFAYNHWANHQILNAAARLTHEQYIAPTTHSFSSLRGTVVHMLDAELAWRELCQNGNIEYFDTLTEDTFPTLDVLVERWTQEERAMRDYLAQLTDDAMHSIIRYQYDVGVMRERVLWHCLWHLANHGTQHRSEAAAILTDYGASPDDLDFTAFLNDNPQYGREDQ